MICNPPLCRMLLYQCQLSSAALDGQEMEDNMHVYMHVLPDKTELLFRISHFLDLCAGGHFHHSNTIHSQQIYTAIAIKGGRVMVWKAIMTVETAGLS